MKPVDVVRAAYAAMGRNDPSVLFDAMDPAVSWSEAEGSPLARGNPYVGPQRVGEGVFAVLLAAIDDFAAVPDTFIDGGNHVAALGRYAGTMKADGAKVDAQFCHVYEFRDGRIVRFQQFSDTAQWSRLMG